MRDPCSCCNHPYRFHGSNRRGAGLFAFGASATALRVFREGREFVFGREAFLGGNRGRAAVATNVIDTKFVTH